MYETIKYPLQLRLGKSCVNASSDTIETPQVKGGWVWRVELCGIENETNDFTELRAYITRGDITHYVFEQESPVSATLYWFTDDFYLLENQKLVFHFDGATVGDVLRVYLNGYMEKTAEGAVIL